MVVKVNNSSNSAPASPDPLRGVAPTSTAAAASSSAPSGSTTAASSGRIAKDKETELEFFRLKKLVPAISKKSTVSKLDVILEAIRYIDQLQDQLVEQIAENKISVAASALLVGKENTEAAAPASAASLAAAARLKALGAKTRHRSQ